MLKETYLAKLVEMRGRWPDAEFIVITRTAHSTLSPSEKLLSDYKRAEKRFGDRWKAWDFVNYEKKI